MKRSDLIRYIEKRDCIFIREGGNHTIYKHLTTGKMSSIPRHKEIKEYLAKKICDDLGISRPR